MKEPKTLGCNPHPYPGSPAQSQFDIEFLIYAPLAHTPPHWGC